MNVISHAMGTTISKGHRNISNFNGNIHIDDISQAILKVDNDQSKR